MIPSFSRETLLSRPSGASFHMNVRFQDVDAAGVVFFPTLLVYMHDAYVALLEQVGTPLPRVLQDRRWIAPIAECHAEFLKPLRFGDSVEVQVVAATASRVAMRLGYRILRGDEAVAVGQTVHVFLAGGRPTAVPPEIAAWIAGLQSD